MKITKDNYEIWFLDYMEGRLNEAGKEELHLFMSIHPDLATELDAYIPTISANNCIVFPNKELLKKELYNDPVHFETTVVAAMEGDLNEEEFQALENWLTKNPEKQKFFRELEKIKLKPDTRIIFPAKDRLKKRATVMTGWMRVSAAAAILLLAILLFNPGKKERKQENQTIATSISPQIVNPAESTTVVNHTFISETKNGNQVQRQTAAILRQKNKQQMASVQIAAETRQIDRLETLESRTCPVNSIYQEFAGLVSAKSWESALPANAEITLSDFLNNKLQEMKANGPKGFITREEVALAGLHLFSRLPGNHLTGRKGSNGRLTSISLNTQLLAISIPVNR